MYIKENYLEQKKETKGKSWWHLTSEKKYQLL